MKKIITFFGVLLFLSCSSKRIISTNGANSKFENIDKSNEVTTQKSVSELKSNTTQNILMPIVNTDPINTTDKVAIYIHKYKTIAQYEMRESGIPASITLAQGILESGAGRGELTQRANNHFGIKCHNWNGEKVYHDDDRKGECFRKYAHPSESFKDHSDFLTSRSRYSSLFELNEKDYKGWAKGLRKAGYATDPKYPSKLISLIERYDLHNYDDLSSSLKINKNDTVSKNIYTVNKGDTLYSVSRKFNISVSELMKLNALSGNNLSIGQQLIVK